MPLPPQEGLWSVLKDLGASLGRNESWQRGTGAVLRLNPFLSCLNLQSCPCSRLLQPLSFLIQTHILPQLDDCNILSICRFAQYPYHHHQQPSPLYVA